MNVLGTDGTPGKVRTVCLVCHASPGDDTFVFNK